MLMMIARTHAIFQSTVAHETPFCAPRLCADWMLEPGHSSVGLSIKGSGLGVRSTGSRKGMTDASRQSLGFGGQGQTLSQRKTSLHCFPEQG